MCNDDVANVDDDVAKQSNKIDIFREDVENQVP